VLAACRAANLFFLEAVTADDVVEKLEEGVMIGAGRDNQAAAELGRRHTQRALPW
jgi:hypothetical protein